MKKIMLLSIPLLIVISLLLGCECGWEYEYIPPIKTHSQPADKTKDFPFLIVNLPHKAKVFVDGKEVSLPEDICTACVVKIEMTPEKHKLAWGYYDVHGSSYTNRGVLDAKYKGVYAMRLGYEWIHRVGDPEYTHVGTTYISWVEKYETGPISTYIVDECTNECLIGAGVMQIICR